ncbi:MAG: alpha/beta hydrolase [Sphingomonadales bacterium]|jgi:pimeloyl-ACP methyl ester carboxylesterase
MAKNDAASDKSPLHHIAMGSGDNIAILLHGFPMNHHLWDFVAPLLADDMRLIIPDLRGFGQSLVKGPLELSLKSMADDVAQLMSELGIEKAHIIGASMGAMVAMAFAYYHGERTQSVVVMHSEADPDDEEIKIRRNAQIKTIRNQGSNAFAHQFARRVLGSDTEAEKLTFVSNMMADASAKAMVAGMRLLRDREDLRLLLPRIEAPALVVAGQNDPHSPADLMEQTAALFPNGQFHIMDNANHLSAIECPQSAAKVIRGWVGSHT